MNEAQPQRLSDSAREQLQSFIDRYEAVAAAIVGDTGHAFTDAHRAIFFKLVGPNEQVEARYRLAQWAVLEDRAANGDHAAVLDALGFAMSLDEVPPSWLRAAAGAAITAYRHGLAKTLDEAFGISGSAASRKADFVRAMLVAADRSGAGKGGKFAERAAGRLGLTDRRVRRLVENKRKGTK